MKSCGKVMRGLAMSSNLDKKRFSLLKNRGLKIAALILAVVSWYAIRGAINFESLVKDVPMVVRLNSGWAVLDRSTDVVDVLFRGSRDEVVGLNRMDMELVLDLRGRSRLGLCSTVWIRK